MTELEELVKAAAAANERIREAGREASRLRALANAADKEQQDRIHEAHEAEEAVKKAVLKQVRPRDFARLYPKENNDFGTGKEGEK